MTERGFSILEVMITLVITGITLGLISSNLNGLKKLTSRFNEQAVFREQYLIFLLIFEEDYQTGTIQGGKNIALLDSLVFQHDLNMDGDLNDAGEIISYRWNEDKQRIDRKSGDGSFQAFLDGVSSFDWQQVSSRPICYRLEISSVFSVPAHSTIFCRSVSN